MFLLPFYKRLTFAYVNKAHPHRTLRFDNDATWVQDYSYRIQHKRYIFIFHSHSTSYSHRGQTLQTQKILIALDEQYIMFQTKNLGNPQSDRITSYQYITIYLGSSFPPRISTSNTNIVDTNS